MKDTTISRGLTLPNQPPLFDLDALYTCLQTVSDQRDRRGLRYPLAAILPIGVLAKLAGQDSSRAIAHWAKLRQRELSTLFRLTRHAMPHYSTWSRVLGRAVEPRQVERVPSQFFAAGVGKAPEPKRASLALCIDGKILRRTIPAGQREARASGGSVLAQARSRGDSNVRRGDDQ